MKTRAAFAWLALVAACARAAEDEFTLTIEGPPAGVAIAGTLTRLGAKITGGPVREVHWEFTPPLDVHYDDDDLPMECVFADPEPKTVLVTVYAIHEKRGFLKQQATIKLLPYVRVSTKGDLVVEEPEVAKSKGTEVDPRPVDPRKLVVYWSRRSKSETWSQDVARIASAMRKVAIGMEQSKVGGAPIAEVKALAAMELPKPQSWDGFFEAMTKLFAKMSEMGAFGAGGQNAGSVAASLRVFADELDKDRLKEK